MFKNISSNRHYRCYAQTNYVQYDGVGWGLSVCRTWTNDILTDQLVLSQIESEQHLIVYSKLMNKSCYCSYAV